MSVQKVTHFEFSQIPKNASLFGLNSKCVTFWTDSVLPKTKCYTCTTMIQNQTHFVNEFILNNDP